MQSFKTILVKMRDQMKMVNNLLKKIKSYKIQITLTKINLILLNKLTPLNLPQKT